MKKANPDLYQVATASYLNKIAFIKRFIRYWGTTTVNGREVLLDKNYYYPTWTQRADFERWAKLLGIWGDVRDPKMKGVRRAWLYLNPDKGNADQFTDDLIASNLDAVMAKTEGPLTVDMYIGPVVNATSYARSISKLQIQTPTSDQAGIIAEIEGEMDYLWNNAIISSGTPTDVYKDVLTRYIMRSNDVPYVVKEVSAAMVETSVPYTSQDCDDE